jgi:DNA-directed RNA polymerase specialized sigma24 family protein
MTESEDFQDLIRRVRTGDAAAAATLIRAIEPFVLRAARIRLSDGRLRRALGSSDICQSVLLSLIQGLRRGKFELVEPEQLENLLCTMVLYKLTAQARRPANARHVAPDWEGDQGWDEPVAPGTGPEERTDDQDLLETVLKQFSEDELQLLIRRADGQDWADIAAVLGGNPDALRKKLERAKQRVRGRFGPDDGSRA